MSAADDYREALGGERRIVVDRARKVVREVFSDDAVAAREAAYAMVSHSRHTGGGFDTNKAAADLTDGELETFHAALTDMLAPMAGRINIAASRIAKVDGIDEIKANVFWTRLMAFDIGGRAVVIGRPTTGELTPEQFEIGCPIAVARSEPTILIGDGAVRVMEAQVVFRVPSAEAVSTLPVVFVEPGNVHVRRVRIEEVA